MCFANKQRHHVRVVKETDLKSVGLWRRRFKPCWSHFKKTLSHSKFITVYLEKTIMKSCQQQHQGPVGVSWLERGAYSEIQILVWGDLNPPVFCTGFR